MEFIQKKTADNAVEHFLTKAADQEIPLVWDRYEGQLPVCGFCEAGLSCRDCLQGPCISHPFRDQSKKGVCGKDKHILSVQSLLRLVIKGSMSSLDQLGDFAKDVENDNTKPKDKAASKILKEVQALFSGKGSGVFKELPSSLIARWKEVGVYPEGFVRDLFKASQKLEGGIAGVEETLLWTFKTALLNCMAQQIQRKLKRSIFGEIKPTKVEVNLGVLQKEAPNILLLGRFSPALKQKIAEVAKKGKVKISGVCTEPLVPPHIFSPVTNYGSQEIPVMTGAIDLIVAGDQFVNPSIAQMARDWKVTVVPANGLNQARDTGGFAQKIVDLAKKAFDNRTDVPKDIPDKKDTAIMGFSADSVDVKKIVTALDDGNISGVVIFSGSSNIKYTQDYEYVSMAKEFLRNDILCVSEGEASVALAKYGFLDPKQDENYCGDGLTKFLKALGKNLPAIIDCNATDFLLAAAESGKKALNAYPVFACFPEANRSVEVANALGMVAMGVTTYFWPCLPVTGSPEAMNALIDFCVEKFGAKLHVLTKKLSATEKAKLMISEVIPQPTMSGKTW